jgi:hypothetical protein
LTDDEDEDKESGPEERTEGDGQEGTGISLASPDEWEDPPDAEVISEFHKPKVKGKDEEEEEKEDDEGVEDSDLEAWLEHWQKRSSLKVLSEYHKEGAPFLDDPFVESPTIPVEPLIPPKPEVATEERPPKKKGKKGKKKKKKWSSEPTPIAKLKEIEVRPKKEFVKRKPKTKGTERVIDITTIEFLAFTVIRALFPKRVSYSIKKEGLLDMDITIDDRDIIFNYNRFLFELPEMSIWRLIFAYKGKPVMEIGRGVKGGLKIHRFRLLRVVFSMWLSERKKKKPKKKY